MAAKLTGKRWKGRDGAENKKGVNGWGRTDGPHRVMATLSHSLFYESRIDWGNKHNHRESEHNSFAWKGSLDLMAVPKSNWLVLNLKKKKIRLKGSIKKTTQKHKIFLHSYESCLNKALYMNNISKLHQEAVLDSSVQLTMSRSYEKHHVTAIVSSKTANIIIYIYEIKRLSRVWLIC